jgi:hypothetical protein
MNSPDFLFSNNCLHFLYLITGNLCCVKNMVFFMEDTLLCHRMITIKIITFNTTQLCCLLKQHVSTPLGRLKAKRM